MEKTAQDYVAHSEQDARETMKTAQVDTFGSPKTAQDHMTDMVEEPTLNEFFMRNPKDITDAELARLVARNRDDRALFIAKGETTRKEKDDE